MDLEDLAAEAERFARLSPGERQRLADVRRAAVELLSRIDPRLN